MKHQHLLSATYSQLAEYVVETDAAYGRKGERNLMVIGKGKEPLVSAAAAATATLAELAKWAHDHVKGT